VAGPALYAAAPPSAAVALALIVGQVVNVLILFGERRRPLIDWSGMAPALAAALPGLPLGALVVRAVPGRALRVAVGLVVCTIVLRRVLRRGGTLPAAGPRAAYAAGLAAGVLTTSTTTNGPPLAIWLTARRLEPAAIRDVATALFVVLDLAGLVALVAVVGAGPAFARARWLPTLVAVSVVGHLVGRQLFLRLPVRTYEPLVLAAAFAAGCLSLAASLA